MQIEETSAEGLSRELKITISKDTLATRLDTKILELKDQVQLKGFRKGKVPVTHLKKIYGSRLMSEILQEVVNDQSQQALSDRDERPALQPEVNLEGDVENVINGDADFIFNMIYDIIPPITLANFKDISLDRKVAEISDTEVDESIQRLAESRKQFEPKAKTAKAASGDSVKIDFLGKIDGEPFEGGAAEGFELELGSNQFIPGFEDQIIGKKAGDSFDIEVSFPEDYGNADLANKAAVFETTVHEVSGPKKIEINDEFATSMGMESLDQLKDMVREQISKDYQNFSREQVKRDLLDKLSDAHDFELPNRMVDLEFNQIWHQFESELENQGKKIDELDETENELRTEYREIAERRVRTGLVLAEIGSNNEIEVTQEEINQGLMERVRQFPGQEQEVFNYFRNNPEAMAQIRAPLFENKVIDFVIEQADVTDITVSIEELMAPPEESEEKPKAKKKPAKKTAAKKAPAKKADTKEDDKKPSEFYLIKRGVRHAFQSKEGLMNDDGSSLLLIRNIGKSRKASYPIEIIFGDKGGAVVEGAGIAEARSGDWNRVGDRITVSIRLPKVSVTKGKDLPEENYKYFMSWSPSHVDTLVLEKMVVMRPFVREDGSKRQSWMSSLIFSDQPLLVAK